MLHAQWHFLTGVALNFEVAAPGIQSVSWSQVNGLVVDQIKVRVDSQDDIEIRCQHPELRQFEPFGRLLKEPWRGTCVACVDKSSESRGVKGVGTRRRTPTASRMRRFSRNINPPRTENNYVRLLYFPILVWRWPFT